jgi:hypothetical protein
MKRFWCWLLGHDRMQNGARHRSCLRCGMRETRRQYGSTVGWEEGTEPPGRGSGAAERHGRGHRAHDVRATRG